VIGMSSDERSKHALLIGINKYANLSERAQLQGCVNDAKLMRDVLIEHYGFDDGDIRHLGSKRRGIRAIR